jgi:nucleotide-binding universal stress UspA family protein
MFKHLLVPLDGSRLAESALPAAVRLAQLLGATLTLVHVIERKAPQEVHGERHLTTREEANAYLEEVRRRAFPATLHVNCHVHSEEVTDVAKSIVEHISELTPDLIVMCTHGRGGLRGWLFGSIAQQVIARHAAPVLFIRPTEYGTAPPFSCRRLLVPLDGSPAHEVGLAMAAGLAQACRAMVHIVMVVPTISDLFGERAATGRLLPKAMTEVLEVAQQSADTYLARLVHPLEASGLDVTAEVSRGDSVTAIVNTAQKINADIVVLGTHGKSGLDALYSGSVAPKVATHTRVPLLLVPLPSSQESEAPAEPPKG